MNVESIVNISYSLFVLVISVFYYYYSKIKDEEVNDGLTFRATTIKGKIVSTYLRDI
jgi:hypothetical protein